jgi:phage terminase large subunit GpA-like protein
MVVTPTIESSFTGLLETARPRPVVYPKALAPIRRFFEFAQPRRVRTMREFAEQEIILPTGPERGNLFSTKFMPWTGLLLDEFSAGRYKEFWITGPVQDGKTTLAFIIPIMYYLFEMYKDVIVGVPRMELAQGKWDIDLKPMIESSRNYAHLLPEKGRGSRGGKTEELRFGNGARLRFMAAGGGDEQRSSFTAEIIVITEVDKMDVPGKASRESDPVTQIKARAAAFAKLGTAIVFGECTMSNSQGRINQEVVVKGTNSKIYVPCPYCQTYIVCERENFKGWQGAKDMLEACENAAYVCQECQTPWTEDDRLHALASPVLAAEGQTVDKDGAVAGDPPRTQSFGFSWNTMYSALKDMSFIAEKEFEAVRSEKVEAAKDLMQFTWALPYEEEIEDLSGVTVDTILSKISRHPRGMVPPGTSKITVGVDTGLWWCWYSVWAWTEDAQGYCIDYNDIQVPQPDRHNPDPLNILKALQVFRYEVLEPGWMVATGERTGADLVLVDSGFKNDITYAFTRESGEKFYPSKGFGSKPNQNKWTQPKPG